MAGRRRTGYAAASALNLLGELMLADMTAQRERKEKAVELARKFEIEIAVERAKKGLPYTDPFTGQQVAGVQREVPMGLEVSEYTDPVTGVKYTRPRSGSEISSEEERKFREEAALIPGTPFAGEVPIGEQRRGALQRGIDLGITESPAAVPRALATPSQFPGLLGESGRVPSSIIRTGRDTATGRRVGMTREGKIVPLD